MTYILTGSLSFCVENRIGSRGAMVEAGRPIRCRCKTSLRDDDVLDHGHSSREGEKWLGSVSILTVAPRGIADRVDREY